MESIVPSVLTAPPVRAVLGDGAFGAFALRSIFVEWLHYDRQNWTQKDGADDDEAVSDEHEEVVEDQEGEEEEEDEEDEDEEELRRWEWGEANPAAKFIARWVTKIVLEAQLFVACENGHLVNAQQALRRGALVVRWNRQNTSTIGAAVASGNRPLVKLLMSALPTFPAPDNSRVIIRDPPGVGYTMLMIACTRGDLEMARMLLVMGENTELVSHKGYTALLLACEGGYVAVVQLLVRWGADVNFMTYDAIDHRRRYRSGVLLHPLVMAVSRGFHRVVQSLVASGRLAPCERVFGFCLALCANEGVDDMCLVLASIGADLGGGIPVHDSLGGWRTHAEAAAAAGHRRLAFRLAGEIRGNAGGCCRLPCIGPPPLESRKLFWRDDYQIHRAAYEGYRALRVEWREHIGKCSGRARLVIRMHRARAGIGIPIQGAAGVVLQPTAGPMLPWDAVLRVVAFVSDDEGGAWTALRVVQSALGPQAPRPKLVLVASTLASQLTKELEELGKFDPVDTRAQMARIRTLEQKAAGGGCEWLAGYCSFLRDWLLR